MSLLTFQTILLEIYTNEEARELFFTDPSAALDRHPEGTHLTDRERRALLSLSEERVRDFAMGLQRKRISIVNSKIFKRGFLKKSPVILFPTYKIGPALYFRVDGGKKEIHLSRGQYRLFLKVADSKVGLSFTSLVHAYKELLGNTNTGATLRDLFHATKTVATYRLGSRPIRTLTA